MHDGMDNATTLIYLVMRRPDGDHGDHVSNGGSGTPTIAFADPKLAFQHAQDATRELGVPHDVTPIPLTDRLPEPTTRHSLTMALALDGAELWRNEEQVVGFAEHPEASEDEVASWAVVVRDTPSQPPSRVKLTLVGPSRDWCMTRADQLWAEARGSHQFREAVEIEEMFSYSLDQ